jgi:hypothetical protein
VLTRASEEDAPEDKKNAPDGAGVRTCSSGTASFPLLAGLAGPA